MVLRASPMPQQGKHSRPSSGNSTEKDAKQPKQEEGGDMKVNQPTAREIAAAEAARARLYGQGSGGPSSNGEQNARLPTGAEPTATAEIEYISTEALQPVSDAASSLAEGLSQATQADWVANCSGLLLLRRVIVHHRDTAYLKLEEIMVVIVKHVKSLRSSLCKTAIMCATDSVGLFQDSILPYLNIGGPTNPGNSLLSQLLLKASSNDKRFVIEEAKVALQAVVRNISPFVLLDLLLPQVAHKSPKVRGAAAVVLADSLSRLSPSEWTSIDIDGILKVAAKLLSDNTPDARNSAKKIIPLLHAAYDQKAEEKENAQENGTCPNSSEDASEEGPPFIPSWDAHCKLCLGGSANAVLKAT